MSDSYGNGGGDGFGNNKGGFGGLGSFGIGSNFGGYGGNSATPFGGGGFGSPTGGYGSGPGVGGFGTSVDGAAGFGSPSSGGGNQGTLSGYGDRNSHYQNGFGTSSITETAKNPRNIMNPDQGNNYGNVGISSTQNYGNVGGRDAIVQRQNEEKQKK